MRLTAIATATILLAWLGRSVGQRHDAVAVFSRLYGFYIAALGISLLSLRLYDGFTHPAEFLYVPPLRHLPRCLLHEPSIPSVLLLANGIGALYARRWVVVFILALMGWTALDLVVAESSVSSRPLHTCSVTRELARSVITYASCMLFLQWFALNVYLSHHG